MKVAHVINSLNRGGAESHLLELVKAQSNTGLTTDVIVIGEDSSDILSIKKELSSVCRKIYRLKGPRMFNIFSYIKLQKIIRNNSYKWRINPKKIGVLGFSAGGHLASTISTHYDQGLSESNLKIERETSCRPDFTVLIYPVITLQNSPATHYGSRENLLGKIPNQELVDYYSNELQVKFDTPPAILIHTNEDSGVPPENSILYYLALREYDIPAAIHIWEKGEHGLGLVKGEKSFQSWPKTCKEWMIERNIIN